MVRPLSRSQHTAPSFQPAVLATESSLELDEKKRERVVWRTDGGAGSEENIRWLLNRNYQFMMKGNSNRRAHLWAQQVTRWDPCGDVFLAEIPSPIKFNRPVRIFLKKRVKNEQICVSYYISTIKLPSKRHFISYYDNRGAAEIEQFRNDKMGLHLASRRKTLFLAQKSLILLADLAHNLIGHFHQQALVDTRFEPFRQKRIVRDLLQIPGFLSFQNGSLSRIDLLSSHPYSRDLLICLKSYLEAD
ncbi:transposase [Chloroflexi bacterium TSY]|nr:transposase [Chloroflexi bacterium TSY]